MVETQRAGEKNPLVRARCARGFSGKFSPSLATSKHETGDIAHELNAFPYRPAKLPNAAGIGRNEGIPFAQSIPQMPKRHDAYTVFALVGITRCC